MDKFTFTGPWEVKRLSIKAIADMQRGKYVERPNVDIIGMYCVRSNTKGVGIREDGTKLRNYQPCYTTISECLIMDNRWWHGRRGPVGNRLLIRFWVTKSATLITKDS